MRLRNERFGCSGPKEPAEILLARDEFKKIKPVGGLRESSDRSLGALQNRQLRSASLKKLVSPEGLSEKGFSGERKISLGGNVNRVEGDTPESNLKKL